MGRRAFGHAAFAVNQPATAHSSLSPLKQGGGPGAGTSRVHVMGRDGTVNGYRWKRGLTLSSTPSPSVATPAPVGTPCWWHQGSSPAGQNLALASSARWPISGAPCTSPGAPRAVQLATPSCHLLQRKRPHPPRCLTSALPTTLPAACAGRVELRGSSLSPPSHPLPQPPPPGLDPHAAAAKGSFMGKGFILTPALSPSPHKQEPTNAPHVC